MLMLLAEREAARAADRRVGERLLDHALAVVERTAHREGPDVVRPSR